VSTSAQHQDPAWYFEEDQTPQGPVPQAALPGFVAARRITSETLVWTAGMADWLPASDVPLLVALLVPTAPPQHFQPPQPPVQPPPPPPQPVMPAPPAHVPQPQTGTFALGNLPHAPGPPMPAPPIQPGMIRSSVAPSADGLAIAALVLGCFSCSLGLCLGVFGVPFGIAGVVCGTKSATPGSIRTAGIVTSIVGIVLTVIFGVIGIIMSLSSNSSTFP